ncbi:hypothetical protein AMAG_05463 [Allomyces macrogynus ATCC 38327]|uniref:glucan 1,4-alpha-glucosidase n=1 Tax=Allomyces macrogynus (strain ATCC 38327) TaxID=578462 RepID=A0A0L0SBV2_ALLM3|nr:hypothetical protein AMAG_05463 [Allomyces macrogynus ATCC 38327]|eukprot:KNE60023.1 hypothetical protein AMAG_05463 [Allomyces macrogynus ATCC 38327]
MAAKLSCRIAPSRSRSKPASLLLLLVAAALLVLGLADKAYSVATTKRAETGWDPVEFTSWVATQRDKSLNLLVANISPAGTSKGCVVAAQSKSDPNYWYYWVRDGALVMDVIGQEYATTKDAAAAKRFEQLMWDFIDFNTAIQSVPTRSASSSDPLGLGEPKYHVNGAAFNDEWGRPQNDGPALRASTTIRFVQAYLNRGGSLERVKKLYRPAMPADTLVKRDLEMVSHNLGVSNFDLWEEVKGQHLYTNTVQRRALVEGATFAQFFNDTGAAQWYQKQSGVLTSTFDGFWDSARGYFGASQQIDGGLRSKSSNLDVAVILAALHGMGDITDGILTVDDDRVLATAHVLAQHHLRTFAVNTQYRTDLPPAIGRYEEDTYLGGNPWFLTTLAMAELHYRVAARAARRGSITVTGRSVAFFQGLPGAPSVTTGTTIVKNDSRFSGMLQALMNRGDGYMVRTRVHMGADGRMDEQIDRWTGPMKSAKALTGSYAAFVTAATARDAARDPVRAAIKA